MIRRLVDLVVAVVALVALSPLFAIISLAIVIDSPGNPFYGGWRVGRGAKRFRMWKFRSMVTGADRQGPGITARADRRITRVGGLLRRTKLDELPQFFNLLAGDLTVVGPRAEVPEIVARYTPEQRELLAVKPGITGPGQLYYTTDQESRIPPGVPPEEYYVQHLLAPKLEIDLDYVRTRTTASDLRMVARTAGVMLKAMTGGAAHASTT